jgi:heme-degrading monooxygenase HmoA
VNPKYSVQQAGERPRATPAIVRSSNFNISTKPDFAIHIRAQISYVLCWMSFLEDFMVHILVRHKVSDYNRWKEAFDSHLSLRKRSGETGFRLFHNTEDPHDIFLLLDWQTAEEARKFINSDELRNAMQEAGVVGAPEVQYLEDARSVYRTSAD